MSALYTEDVEVSKWKILRRKKFPAGLEPAPGRDCSGKRLRWKSPRYCCAIAPLKSKYDVLSSYFTIFRNRVAIFSTSYNSNNPTHKKLSELVLFLLSQEKHLPFRVMKDLWIQACQPFSLDVSLTRYLLSNLPLLIDLITFSNSHL